MLTVLQEGLADQSTKSSVLAHCLAAEYWLSLEEYESAVETSRKGLKLAKAESTKSDLSLQR
jgi:superkiller protein 3